MEIFKDIEGFEGVYQISNLGTVKNIKRNKIKKNEIDIDGYVRVGLSKNGKQNHYKIHRLVAQAFLPNPKNLPQVNHKDENKTNNNVTNLEWCTNEYNHNYGTINQRIAEKLSKPVMCIETGEIYTSVKEARSKTTLNHIDAVCRGERNKCGGFHWCYV